MSKTYFLNKTYLHTAALTLFFFLIAHVYVCAQSLSCVQPSDPMDCSPPSSVHGILQARILEWVVMPSSRESSQPKDRTRTSCISYIGR